jgi:glycerate kinase
MVGELDAALARYADVVEAFVGRSVRDVAGAGAAGGLGAGLIAFLDAHLRSGAELVLESTGFDARLERAELVITGEGRIDGQSAYGKLTQAVSQRAMRVGKPTIAIVGGVGQGHESLFDAGLTALETTSKGPTSLADALANAESLIEAAAERVARTVQVGLELSSVTHHG